METTKYEQNREQGLTELGAAYMKVRDGKAGCVMILIENEQIMLQTANVSTAEALQAVAQANGILIGEVITTLAKAVE